MPYPNYTTQELAAINSYLQNEAELARDQRNLLREINLELQGKINYTKEATKQYRVLEDISYKLKEDAEEMSKLSERDLDKLKDKARKSLDELKYVGRKLVAEYKIKDIRKEDLKNLKVSDEKHRSILSAVQNSFQIERQNLRLVERRIEFNKNLNKSVGLTGAALSSVAKITDKLGLHGVDHIFEDARKAAEKKAKALGVSNKHSLGLIDKFKVMLATIKPLGGGLFKAFNDPLVLLGLQFAIFKKIFNVVKEQDQLLTNQGRQLGISAEESQKLFDASHKYALASKDSFLTGTKLTEARQALNKELNISTDLGDKNNEVFARLTHFYELSGEAASKLVELGVEQKGNGLDTFKTIVKTYGVQKAQYGNSLSLSKTLERVSTISSGIYTKFKGNVEALTAAVMQADRLGLSLEQTEQVGERLLDFESSIEAELKAELLTGKAINLEKARQYALDGNLMALNKEIAKEIGGIHQFEKLNTIERKAYAEAMGMSVEEMAKMLRKREFERQIEASGAKSAKEKLEYATKHKIQLDDVLRNEYEQKSLAEEQHEVFARLKSVLVKIMDGPMRGMIKQLKEILHTVLNITDKFGGFTGSGFGAKLGAGLLLLPGIAMVGSLIKSLVFNGMSPATAPWVKVAGGGMVGGTGMGVSGRTVLPSGAYVEGGKAFSSTGKPLTGAASTNVLTAAGNMKPGGGGGFGKYFTGARGFATGAGLGLGGMALQSIASGMEPGAGASALGVLGSTAQYAGIGTIFGPYGAAIGGLVGLGMGLFSLSKENEERRKQEDEERKTKEAAQAESQKKTNELIEQLTLRPVKLTIGSRELGEFSTSVGGYGSSAFNN